MYLLQPFVDFIKKEHLFNHRDPLIIAVSGGVDSVVLCELCHQAGFTFSIAHCNFRLRDAESERDKQFVVSLAERYGVDILVKEFDTTAYAAQKKISIQEAARELRYDWFNELTAAPPESSVQTANHKRKNTDGSKVLLAHHADDNIETMLMNFFRGTGIQGLKGMVSKHGNLIRPLLFFRKTELVQFAKDHDLVWVEDSSNQSDKYSRNYFRNNIIPLVKNIYPEAEQNLLNNLQRFNDIQILYRQSVERHLEKLLVRKGNEVHVPVLKLKMSTPLFTIIYEIIKQYHFTAGQVAEVTKLLDSDTGRYVQSPTHRIIKNRNWLIISPNATEESAHIPVKETDTSIIFSLGELRLKRQSGEGGNDLPTTNNIAHLNASDIVYPLLLRKWKPGDYFYPLGMRKKKKLARFLIDQKVSKVDKEKIWVVEMEKKIIWVVGMRIDDRFKVLDYSKPFLSMTLKRKQSS